MLRKGRLDLLGNVSGEIAGDSMGQLILSAVRFSGNVSAVIVIILSATAEEILRLEVLSAVIMLTGLITAEEIHQSLL